MDGKSSVVYGRRIFTDIIVKFEMLFAFDRTADYRKKREKKEKPIIHFVNNCVRVISIVENNLRTTGRARIL